MNISLPAPLKEWVDEQVVARGYGTASEFVRDLLRKEQLDAERDRIEAHLLESLASGPPTRMTEKDWEEIRKEGLKMARRLRKK